MVAGGGPGHAGRDQGRPRRPSRSRGAGHPRDRDKAAEVSAKLGTASEKAVVPYLKHRDRAAHLAACEVLKAVGTADSEADLRAAAGDADPAVGVAARSALAAVEARQGKKPAEAP